jgi:antitoxin component of RelBE/YafQ-DinJ toxin-antitoxin module
MCESLRSARHQIVGRRFCLSQRYGRCLKKTNTEILADSIKSPSEAVKTLLAGAHQKTLPFDVLQAMIVDELSPQTVDEFAKKERGIGAKLFCLLLVRLGNLLPCTLKCEGL